MQNSELLSYDPDKYAEELENALWDNPVVAMNMNEGHSDIHYFEENPQQEAISRIIRESVRGAGAFPDQDTAMQYIQDAAIYKINEITDWMMTSKNEFDDPKEYFTKALTVYMGESETTGVNYDSQFRELESKSVTLVLQRDYEAYNPYGFYLKTAYPNIHEEHTKFTGKQLSREEIIKDGIYKFRSKLEETAFASGINRDGVKVYYGRTQGAGEEYVKLSVKGEVNAFTVYLQENRTKAYMYHGTEKQKISLQELDRDCPVLSHVLKQSMEYMKKKEPDLSIFAKSFEELCKKAMEKAEEQRKQKRDRNVQKPHIQQAAR